MHVPFVFKNMHRKAEECMLLNSSMTENFMDQRMISQLKIGTKQLPTPRKVHNVDGTENQGILEKPPVTVPGDRGSK
jgi:hypothetical protein